MDLRNWERDSTGAAVVGADVYVYEATTSHPNAGSLISQTQTDPNGMWSFSGLTDSPKDVKIVKNPGPYQITRWYKGLVRVGVDQIETNYVNPQNARYHNPILNSSFNIWQAGQSVGAANATYHADGWLFNMSTAATATVTPSSDIPAVSATSGLGGSSLYIDFTAADSSIAAGDVMALTTRIEGYDFAPLAQKIFTLSFWVKSTKTGTFCVSFGNSGADRYYVAEYTVNATNTWEYKTITVPASPSGGTWDYTTGRGLRVSWALLSGSTSGSGVTGSWQTGDQYATSNQVNASDPATNDFRLYAPCITLGSYAAPAAPLPVALQLLRCQRYFCKTFPAGTTPAQNTGNFAGTLAYKVSVAGTTQGGVLWQFPVPMKATPTVTFYNPAAANSNWRNSTDAADSGASSIGLSGENSVLCINAQAAGDGAGESVAIHATAAARL